MVKQMEVPTHLLEIGKSKEQKFNPVISFDGWRIAMLRYFSDMDVRRFRKVERHNETNEVFILTHGEADMILCDNGDKPGQAYVFKMELNVAYNLAKSVWHNVVMSKDAHIIVFEKSDTTTGNSNYEELSDEVIDDCKKQFTAAKKKVKKKKKKTKKSKADKKQKAVDDLASSGIQQLTLWPELQ